MKDFATHPDADAIARLALAHLPQLGPVRGRWLLDGPNTAVEVVTLLRSGALPTGLGPAPRGVTAEVVQGWQRGLRRLDPLERWDAHHTDGLELLTPGHPAWPFLDDPDPPLMLWARGHLELLAPPASAAIVGSRRCSNVGSRVAFSFGRDLAAAGVSVVSGLAAGIDAAAHLGALSVGGDAVAVVATGPDVVYPRSSAELWQEVARRGLIVGEAPLGVHGQRWRFPARNRLIAALAQAVVVVESHASGGALHTVTEAERRQVPILAVPGSVLNAASAGTNQLLFDGAGVARDAADVLLALGLPSAPPPAQGAAPGGRDDGRRATLLSALGAGPVPLDVLFDGPDGTDVASVVQRLVTEGHIEVRGGMVALAART